MIEYVLSLIHEISGGSMWGWVGSADPTTSPEVPRESSILALRPHDVRVSTTHHTVQMMRRLSREKGRKRDKETFGIQRRHCGREGGYRKRRDRYNSDEAFQFYSKDREIKWVSRMQCVRRENGDWNTKSLQSLLFSLSYIYLLHKNCSFCLIKRNLVKKK